MSRVNLKKTAAVVLSAAMLFGSVLAGIRIHSNAAENEWISADTTAYTPVTVYEQVDTMASGSVYLLGLGNANRIINATGRTSVGVATINAVSPTSGDIYSSNDGSDRRFAGNLIVPAAANTYATEEWLWSNDQLTNQSSTYSGVKLSYSGNNLSVGTSSNNTWTYTDNKLSFVRYYVMRYYLKYNNNAVTVATGDSNNTIYPYIKRTAYRKSGSAGGFYKWDGQTNWAFLKSDKWNDQLLMDSLNIYYKATENGAVEKLSYPDSRLTLVWDQPTTGKGVISQQTGRLYAEGVLLTTLHVDILDEGDKYSGIATDPSTSSIESQFPGVKADDGKVLTDKSVFKKDGYGIFDSYSDDEFAVILSAMGQSYPEIITEETEIREKLHPDVVFILDASGSMIQYNLAGSTTITRAEGTSRALNAAIKKLYETDPETRIGIVTFGFDWFREGIYLPLDKYTLPEGQEDYIIWNGRNVASQSNSGTYNGTYERRTQSSSSTVRNIGNINAPSETTPRPSGVTRITTANGVTYYAGNNNGTMMIYEDPYQWPIARLSTSNTTFTDDNITITRTGNNTATYRVNTYTATTGRYNIAKETVNNMASTNYLINSKGELVSPSSYTFTGGIGTYTQSGLQAGENLFKEFEGSREGRIPATVLISDGVPTVGSTNIQNPPLITSPSTTTGNGVLTQTSDALSNFGLYTIQTADKVKNTVNTLYDREGVFFTIGPGVDYIYGQTILDPSPENLSKAYAQNSAGGSSTEYGNGVPRDLYNKIINAYNGNYADYSDWTYSGNLTSSELTEAFQRVASTLAEVIRPLKQLTSTVESQSAFAQYASMKFSDTIGENMQIVGMPVLLYGDQKFDVDHAEATVDTTPEGDVLRLTYYYSGTVTESSTGKKSNLDRVAVEVLTNQTTGEQRVEWYIPADLIPVVSYDEYKDAYIQTSPIRVAYQVGLVDQDTPGTYYTNSTEKPANVEYIPAIGNPYYYNITEDPDGTKHSTLRTDRNITVPKTENVTGTSANSSDRTLNSTGTVHSNLGNNGEITINQQEIYVTKIWDDGNDAANKRPEFITVQLKIDGANYGAPRTIYGQDCEVTTDENGNDVWNAVIRHLPDGDFDIEITELEIPGYETTTTVKGDTTVITNSRPRVKVTYQLYLVDESTGKPVDQNGKEVSFDNREVMSEDVTVEVYAGSGVLIDYDELLKLLPEGYFIYNPLTSFDEYFGGLEGGDHITITDNTDTTKVYVPNNAVINEDGSVTVSDNTDIKVAFAIGRITNVAPDVVVIDYGLPVKVDVLVNDVVKNPTLTGLSTTVNDGVILNTEGYKNSELGPDAVRAEGAKLQLSAGTVELAGDTVVYTPNSITMPEADEVIYECTAVNGRHYYTTVTVVPATIMYYEDTFVDFEDTANNKWSVSGKNREGYQATDRPGVAEIQAQLDANNVYGYDAANKQCNTFSLDSAHKVTVNNGDYAANGNKWPTATFTFAGTAFDLISMTSGDTGFVTVAVYQGATATGKAYKNWVVDTFYGYTREQNGYMKHEWTYNATEEKWHVVNTVVEEEEEIPESEKLPSNIAAVDTEKTYTTYEINYVWTPTKDTETNNALYQIPIIKSPELPYGTYTVVVTPSYSQFFDHNYTTNADGTKNYKGSYDFYFDAVRVYAPAADYEGYNYDYYRHDSEGWPQFIELRKNILSAAQAQSATGTINGAVFVDSVTDADGTEDYLKYGPNNEVYLKPGQSVSFQLECLGGNTNVDTVQVGVKRLSGNVATIAGSTDKGTVYKEVETLTDMYYTVADSSLFGADNTTDLITLQNVSTNGAYISITNLKITYKQNPVPVKMFMAPGMLQSAVALNNATYMSMLSTCYHRYEYTVVKNPTTTEVGIEKAVCKDCGEEGETRYLPVLPVVEEEKAPAILEASKDALEKTETAKPNGGNVMKPAGTLSLAPEATETDKKTEEVATDVKDDENGASVKDEKTDEEKTEEVIKEVLDEIRENNEMTEEELNWFEKILRAIADFFKELGRDISEIAGEVVDYFKGETGNVNE